MRALVIINPIAGGSRRQTTPAARIALARRVLATHDVAFDTVLTERAGHAEALARQAAADRYDLVFAWGGDGTVNEVARALAFTRTSLAIVPAGSGNGLARALGIPRDPAAAIARALSLPDRLIDGGSLGGRFFVNVAGIGLDAEVALKFDRRTSKRRGPLPYFSIAIPTAARYRAVQYRLTLDDETRTERALILAVANSREYGNGAIVAPKALPDDGMLDVVVIGDRSIAGRILGARRLLDGSLLEAPGVWWRRVRHLVIEADAPRVVFHVDGDPVEAASTTLVADVHAGALTIRA